MSKRSSTHGIPPGAASSSGEAQKQVEGDFCGPLLARQAPNPTAPSTIRRNGTPPIADFAGSAPDPQSDSVAWSFHSRGDGQPHSRRGPRGPRGGRHSARQRRRPRRLSDNPWLVRDQEKEQRSARGRARRRSLLRSSFTASLISPGLRPANHARSSPQRSFSGDALA
jgi:hypothetical protein